MVKDLHFKEDTTKPENRVNIALFHLFMIDEVFDFIKHKLELSNDIFIYPCPKLEVEEFNSSEKPDFKINGIDRKNNSLRYTLNNCVSCCQEFNYLKFTLNDEEFAKWILQLNKYQETRELPKDYAVPLSKRDGKKASVIHSKFITYKYDSVRKNRDFELDETFFEELIQKPCFYCGQYSTILTDGTKLNGIDRVDNEKGYFKNNVVPCCIHCNKAKLKNSQENFLIHIKNLNEWAMTYLSNKSK